jgi:hypothetical protein
MPIQIQRKYGSEPIKYEGIFDLFELALFAKPHIVAGHCKMPSTATTATAVLPLTPESAHNLRHFYGQSHHHFRPANHACRAFDGGFAAGPPERS